jgi:hypothetical protein
MEKEGNKDLIIFIDEDGQQKEIYAQIINLGPATLSFRTSTNLITIPISRLIKIKSKEANK